ncbi:MAG: APC family permease [Candidatus Njordarchaeia archaeon]
MDDLITEQENELHEALGLKEAVAFGMGGMIGAGVFALSGQLAVNLGWYAVIALSIAALTSLSTGLIYGKFATVVRGAGGGYSYVRSICGSRWTSFMAGWLFFLAYSFAGAFYAEVFGLFLYFISGIPWQIFSFGLVVLFLLINIVGVKESGLTESLLTGTKVGIIIVLILAGYISIRNLSPRSIEINVGIWELLIFASSMFIAFEGFDIISTLSQEIKNPKRNIPLAIVITIVSVTGLYILVTLLEVIALGSGLVPSNVYAEEIILYTAMGALGRIGYYLLTLGAIISTVSAYNATLIAVSRVSYALSKDGLFSKRVNHVHHKTKTPYVAIMISSLIIVFIALFSPFLVKMSELSLFLGQLSSLSFLSAFLLVNFSFVRAIKGNKMFVGNHLNLALGIFSISMCLIFAIVLFLVNVVVAVIFFVLLAMGLTLLNRRRNNINGMD